MVPVPLTCLVLVCKRTNVTFVAQHLHEVGVDFVDAAAVVVAVVDVAGHHHAEAVGLVSQATVANRAPARRHARASSSGQGP